MINVGLKVGIRINVRVQTYLNKILGKQNMPPQNMPHWHKAYF